MINWLRKKTFLLKNKKTIYLIDSDKDKPIFLESDSAKWDENSQKSTYRGNVVVTQGTLLLTGDLLVVTSKSSVLSDLAP